MVACAVGVGFGQLLHVIGNILVGNLPDIVVLEIGEQLVKNRFVALLCRRRDFLPVFLVPAVRHVREHLPFVGLLLIGGNLVVDLFFRFAIELYAFAVVGDGFGVQPVRAAVELFLGADRRAAVVAKFRAVRDCFSAFFALHSLLLSEKRRKIPLCFSEMT